MRDGFIKVAAGTPQIRVADCRYNAEQIFTLMREADKQAASPPWPPWIPAPMPQWSPPSSSSMPAAAL